MADDVTPEQEARDAASFDVESFDDVRAALAGLSHLDPNAYLDPQGDLVPETPMPDWAWERISLALGTEAAARAAASHDNVVLLPTAAAAETAASTGQRGRHSRATRWGGGLVAASVVVVGVAVGFSTLRGNTAPPAIVTAAKLPPAAAAQNTPSAQSSPSAQSFAADAAAGAEAAIASGAAEAGAAPAPQISPTPAASTSETAPADATVVQPRSGIVQAARMVKHTGTAYQQEQLPQQVTDLLDTFGVHDAADIPAMPTATALPAVDGFTENWASVRDCVNWLMKEADSQALIVDRGTFEGDEAGVVVAPANPLDPKPSTPAPTLSLDTDAGLLHVWVVTPECQHVASSIEEEMVLDLQP